MDTPISSNTETNSTKTYIINTIKLLFMMILTGVVVVSSFMAGVTFQKNSASASYRPPISTSSNGEANTTDPADFGVFWEAWDIVEKNFYGDIPQDEDRLYGAIRGMVNTYGDENTAFIDPNRATLLQEDSSGSFEGIGAAVRLDEIGRVVIVEPFTGRPAADAGLLRNDIILEVDGKSLRGLSLYEAILLIRGEAGSTVILTILRDNEPDPFEVSVIRAKIEIEVVEAQLLEGDIAHISLSEFSNGASEKLNRAIQEMRAQGATKLVLDLRNNPGGFLAESVAVSSLFLEEGVVLREKRKGSDQEQVYEARGVHSATDIPMVVLINRGSASASEIVAGALKENDRAAIIGEQSFGKGTVQLPHTLSNGGELRVTIAQWFTPDGNLIHKEGIVPDITVELTQEDYFEGRDPQLDRAVEYLSEIEE